MKINPQSKSPLAYWLLPYSFLVVACMLLGYALPTSGSELAVVTSPFGKTSSARLVVETDGQLVNLSNWTFISVAKSQDPQFISRLYASGAWLVFNAHLVSNCMPSQT